MAEPNSATKSTTEPRANTPQAEQRGAHTASETRGTTSIADGVVAKIAGMAAREVPGIHALGADATQGRIPCRGNGYHGGPEYRPLRRRHSRCPTADAPDGDRARPRPSMSPGVVPGRRPVMSTGATRTRAALAASRTARAGKSPNRAATVLQGLVADRARSSGGGRGGTALGW